MISGRQFTRFVNYLRKREMVRVNRAAGEPWPWTTDAILKQWKFTNVHRFYDRTTTLLRQEMYDAHDTSPDHEIIYNAALFRWFGTIEFARAIGWQRSHDGAKIMALSKERLDKGERVFTGAYMITNGKEECPKHEFVERVLASMWKEGRSLAKIARETRSWFNVYEAMRSMPGYGGSGFMAKEVLLDVMMTDVLRGATDRASWTPVGPGARRGLNRIHERHLDQPLTEEKRIAECLALHKKVKVYWDLFRADTNRFWGRMIKDAPVRPLEAHDTQFALCEFDKYERIRLGNGERTWVSRYSLPMKEQEAS